MGNTLIGKEKVKDEYRILKVDDLMEKLGIGRDKAYALMKSPGFPSTRLGGMYFITEKSFCSWLDSYAGKNYSV